MTASVLAHLLRYTPDGAFSADPMTIEGQVVVDERYGVVLEILLPPCAGQDDEQVLQIPVQQLRRSIRFLT
jgi:hypothetical protein